MRFNQHRKVNLMKPLKLYKIEPIGLPALHVAARSEEQAAQMYVTWAAAHQLSTQSFSVELVALESLEPTQQLQLQALLASSIEGVARYDQDAGWVIDPDSWASFDADEIERPGLRIFQMRDLTPFEALVLANNYPRALKLFERHLRAHGGDPDAVLYREVELQHLDEPASDAVYEALELDHEGVVTCDANGQWAFVRPLGDHQKR
jgi:hypothetical protein